MNYSVVEGLEDQLAQNKAEAELGQVARRLGNNRDFKKLILEGFCLRDAAANVALSADPAANEAIRADALSMAQAGGHLKRYLQYIEARGLAAASQISPVEEALDEARFNEANGVLAAEDADDAEGED